MREFLLLGRRGIPSTATSFHTQKFLEGIYTVLLPANGDPTCLDPTVRAEFEKTVMNSTAFTEAIEKLARESKGDAHYFYLPEKKYSRSRIGGNGATFRTLFQLLWKTQRSFLESFPTTIPKLVLRSAAKMTRTAQIFYDPKENKLREGYRCNYTTNKYVVGRRFLYECMSVVYTLDFLDVPREKSLHLFGHCVKFLFQTIRLERVEGESTTISSFFLPLYHAAVQSYTVDKDPNEVLLKTVTSIMVKKAVDKSVFIYTEFDSWGLKDYINWETMDIVKAETVLFKPSIRDALEDTISKRKLKTASRILDHPHMNYSVQALSHPVRAAIWNNDLDVLNRNNNNCETTSYVWYERAGCSKDENCCASMCDNQAILATGGMTKSRCCQICNQKRCQYEATELQDVGRVYLEPYGYQPPSDMCVLL